MDTAASYRNRTEGQRAASEARFNREAKAILADAKESQRIESMVANYDRFTLLATKFAKAADKPDLPKADRKELREQAAFYRKHAERIESAIDVTKCRQMLTTTEES